MRYDVFNLVGKEVSYYRFVQRVGKGGQACVYKADALIVPKIPVAIKVLLEECSRSQEMRARIYQEALIQCRLIHPHIVRTLDFLDDSGLLGVVMEWVEGQDLKSYAYKQKYLDIEDIARIFLPVLDAVGYAHEKGVIHRDIKPANIYLSGQEGQELPKLLDFGIAKLLQGSRLDTQQGQILGTAAYISPEQITDQPDSPSMDIYSLGVTLYQIATGKLPFEGNSVQMLHGHCDLEPPPPSSRRRDISPALESVILTALRKEPSERFPDCRTFRDALINALDYTAPWQSASALRQETPTSLPSIYEIAAGLVALPSSPEVAVGPPVPLQAPPPDLFPHLARLFERAQKKSSSESSPPIQTNSSEESLSAEEIQTDPQPATPASAPHAFSKASLSSEASPSSPSPRVEGQPWSLEERFALAQQERDPNAPTDQVIPTFTAEEIAVLIARGAQRDHEPEVVASHRASSSSRIAGAYSADILDEAAVYNESSVGPPSTAQKASSGASLQAREFSHASYVTQDASYAQTSEVAHDPPSLHSQETELLPDYMKTYEQTSEEDAVRLETLRRASRSPETVSASHGWSLQTVALLGVLGGATLMTVIFLVAWWSLR